MNRKDKVFNYVKNKKDKVSANDVAEAFELERSNVSRHLNELHREGLIEKIKGRPMLYLYQEIIPTNKPDQQTSNVFSTLIGTEGSLKVSVQQAQAAIHYPPRGLHTLILGRTGTGKSFFAECMYQYALESGRIGEDAPFIQFNCADYAQNPQLLFGHVFGVKKGAFTGATEDRPGLIEKADHGILFLDEIHRLPPEGQEMLFTFIDKGEFRRLGDSEQTKNASVQIIGATTESTESYLLETFTRRIPMTITLPSLEDRQLEERYQLIEHFLMQESGRLNQTIYVERRVLTAFLLYRTSANIGQLQRDLKLACAKTFLHYISKQTKTLLIEQKDIPIHVQKGLLEVKQYREKMDRLLEGDQTVFTFSHGEEANRLFDQDYEVNLYESIEIKLRELYKEGKNEQDIQNELLGDFNQHFNEYIDHLPQIGVEGMVDEQIWRVTDKIYAYVEQQLNRSFEKKMKFAFALHLQGTIERIKQNNIVSHPNLNEIHKEYPKEFKTSIEVAQMIEKELGVEIPLDEIGFIAMFLVADIEESLYQEDHKVSVIVMMHGNTTASSMLLTVQELLGVRHGKAFDMPLSMEVREIYTQVKNAIHEMESTKGVLFLVDMGSLSSFGHMITEEIGIRTKMISMTSTPIVMEAVRKASLGRGLEDIYQSCRQLVESQFSIPSFGPKPVRKAIIAACFTGEGVAKKIKEKLVEVAQGKEIEVISLQFLHRQSFVEKLDQLLEQYDIVAIAGTVQIDYKNIPYFSPMEIFQEVPLKRLQLLLGNNEPFSEMVKTLESHFKMIPSVSNLIELIRTVIMKMEMKLNMTLEDGVDMGIILHLAFLVENIRLNQPSRPFPKIHEFRDANEQDLQIVKGVLGELEQKYDITIEESEFMHIVQMFIENKRE